MAHLHKKDLDHAYNKCPQYIEFPFKHGENESIVEILSRIEPFMHTNILYFIGTQVSHRDIFFKFNIKYWCKLFSGPAYPSMIITGSIDELEASVENVVLEIGEYSYCC